MTHGRKVCEHGTVISQCRCIKSHKTTEVVRPCPFGVHHLGMLIRHPEPPTAGASEGAQLPAVDLWGPSGSPSNPPGPPGAVQGHSAVDTVTVVLPLADYRFITEYDPDPERSASRRELVTVIEEIGHLLTVYRVVDP